MKVLLLAVPTNWPQGTFIEEVTEMRQEHRIHRDEIMNPDLLSEIVFIFGALVVVASLLYTLLQAFIGL